MILHQDIRQSLAAGIPVNLAAAIFPNRLIINPVCGDIIST
jgi:hypothetical protein